MSHNAAGLIDQATCTLIYPKSIAAFCDPTFKLMFGHFLRDTAGRGDTIDKYEFTIFTFFILYITFFILQARSDAWIINGV